MEGEQGSLNGRREVIRGELRRNVMGQLKDQIYLEDEQLYEQIDTAIRQKGKETYLPLKERLWLRNSLYDSFRRLDILQELLDDKDVTEIMINGAGKIFIEKKGNMVLWNRRFEKTEQLEDIIQQIVGKVNRIVNVSSPIADARLEDGSRVHIVLPPVALDGPVVTIRKFPDPITIEKLIRFQALTEESAQFLEQLVKAKYNLFVCGGTNSGKTTFLRTLDLFIENVEILTISNEMDIRSEINKLTESKYELRIVIIEGRESILDMSNTEVTAAIHMINSFIRSPKGKKSLVVWPCNDKDIVDNLVETSRTVGGTALLGLKDTYFSFDGPDKTQFVNIAKQTVELLNNGKTLLDFGITDEIADNYVNGVSTIGEYLKLINSEVRKNKNFVRNLKVKDHCKMWVIVLGQNEPSKDVEALTKGEFLDADVQRLLVSTEANLVQDLKKIPDKIALLSNYLDTKIIYIPIVDALSIVKSYANDDLRSVMKAKGMLLNKDPKIVERLQNSELVRMIQMDTKLMGKKGVTGTNSINSFGKLLEISQTNDRLLNDAFGRALKENGYIDQYLTEQNFGSGLTRRTDLLCKIGNKEIRLEFMWRKSTSKAEIANYTLTKLYNYGRALEFINI